jgi:hypothetical protein
MPPLTLSNLLFMDRELKVALPSDWVARPRGGPQPSNDEDSVIRELGTLFFAILNESGTPPPTEHSGQLKKAIKAVSVSESERTILENTLRPGDNCGFPSLEAMETALNEAGYALRCEPESTTQQLWMEVVALYLNGHAREAYERLTNRPEGDDRFQLLEALEHELSSTVADCERTLDTLEVEEQQPFAQQLASLDRVARFVPDLPRISDIRARIEERVNQLENAMAEGEQLWQAGNVESAETKFNDALSITPDDVSLQGIVEQASQWAEWARQQREAYTEAIHKRHWQEAVNIARTLGEAGVTDE